MKLSPRAFTLSTWEGAVFNVVIRAALGLEAGLAAELVAGLVVCAVKGQPEMPFTTTTPEGE
jgi:hypothetical protein